MFLRKKKTEIWPDLVASPTVFNRVLQKMGVSEFTFVDVFDPDSIPSSAVVRAAGLHWLSSGWWGDVCVRASRFFHHFDWLSDLFTNHLPPSIGSEFQLSSAQ